MPIKPCLSSQVCHKATERKSKSRNSDTDLSLGLVEHVKPLASAVLRMSMLQKYKAANQEARTGNNNSLEGDKQHSESITNKNDLMQKTVMNDLSEEADMR